MQRGPSWVSSLPVSIVIRPASSRKGQWTHNEHITKLVEPKVIHRVGRTHKVTFAEMLIGLRGGDVELVKDPFLHKTLFAGGLFVTRGKGKSGKIQSFRFQRQGDKLWVWIRV